MHEPVVGIAKLDDAKHVYDLVDVIGGRRVRRAPKAKRNPDASHVELCINEAQAVVRRIFALSAQVFGYTRIEKHLNAEHAPGPRPQQARPAAWAPTSVYEVLHRDLYRGVVVWNKTKKRNADRQTAPTTRPKSEWLRFDRPRLRVVSAAAWEAAHRGVNAARAKYERVTHGQRRPHRDRESNYLLTGFARCTLCGGGLHVRSRAHGSHGRSSTRARRATSAARSLPPCTPVADGGDGC